jgi:hypothetical protein
MSKIESLPANQRRAVRALLTKQTIEGAAKFANVGESSIYRWLSDDSFRSALIEAEGTALDSATRRLVGLSEAAIAVITQLLIDREAPPMVRIRAAECVLGHMMKMVEVRNLSARIETLEKRSNETT